MYNLNSEILIFLSNIEPDSIYKTQASEAQNELRNYLKQSEKFKEHYLDSFLSGSYKRGTAIKEIKDVDIIVILNEPATLLKPQSNIKEIYNKLKEVLKEKFDIKNIEQQQRSIKLTWEFDNKQDAEIRKEALTIDIVPAIRSSVNSNYMLWIPDKNLETWIKTNPLGHSDKVTEKNNESTNINGRNAFIPMVKTLKFWKGEYYKIPKKPKGFLLESILYNSWDDTSTSWFECIISVFQSILNKYEAYKFVSSDSEVDFIKDIGLEGEFIRTSTTIKEFSSFISKIQETLDKLAEAKNAKTKYDAIEKLREIFGKEYFPEPKETDKNIKETPTETESISITRGSNKNPEAKPYGQS